MKYLIGFCLLIGACAAPVAEDRWESSYQTEAGALLSVWGSGPTDLWAVGGQGGSSLILHNQGDHWSEVANPGRHMLRWVYGFSASDVYAVGDAGLILHFDGETWTEVESNTQSPLFGLWGNDSGEVWIVGGEPEGSAKAVVLRGQGQHFSVDDQVPANLLPSTLYKVYGGPQHVIAVGTEGTVLRLEDGTWSRETTPTDKPIFSLWGRGEDDLYAVGGHQDGEVLHFDGSEWQTLASDLYRPSLGGVFTAPDEPVVAVGSDGYILELDGQGLSHESFVQEDHLPLPPVLHGVWGDGHGNTFAVGGDLLQYPQAMTGSIYVRNK